MGRFILVVIIICVGLIIIVVLDKKRVKGFIFFGIVVSLLFVWVFVFINLEYV